jgi:hypothetical protein
MKKPPKPMMAAERLTEPPQLLSYRDSSTASPLLRRVHFAQNDNQIVRNGGELHTRLS